MIDTRPLSCPVPELSGFCSMACPIAAGVQGSAELSLPMARHPIDFDDRAGATQGALHCQIKVCSGGRLVETKASPTLLPQVLHNRSCAGTDERLRHLSGRNSSKKER